MVARADSSRPDYGGRGSVGASPELPHDIADLIWKTPGPWQERIALCFAIYDDMPAYAHLMYAVDRYRDFSPEDQRRWWDEVRTRLNSPDAAIRQPLEYALAVDFFEDTGRVNEAWEALTRAEASPALLRAVLRASGPAPWPLKAALYEQLLSDPPSHQTILESLYWSTSDVNAKFDKAAVRQILSRLQLPPGLAYERDLRKRLG